MSWNEPISVSNEETRQRRVNTDDPSEETVNCRAPPPCCK